MYFSIFYKNYKINWVLYDFSEPDISKITEKILYSTNYTQLLSYGNFVCKDKDDLDKIYNILMDEYKKKELEFDNLPNLLTESIKQLLLPNEND